MVRSMLLRGFDRECVDKIDLYMQKARPLLRPLSVQFEVDRSLEQLPFYLLSLLDSFKPKGIVKLFSGLWVATSCVLQGVPSEKLGHRLVAPCFKR